MKGQILTLRGNPERPVCQRIVAASASTLCPAPTVASSWAPRSRSAASTFRSPPAASTSCCARPIARCRTSPSSSWSRRSPASGPRRRTTRRSSVPAPRRPGARDRPLPQRHPAGADHRRGGRRPARRRSRAPEAEPATSRPLRRRERAGWPPPSTGMRCIDDHRAERAARARCPTGATVADAVARPGRQRRDAAASRSRSTARWSGGRSGRDGARRGPARRGRGGDRRVADSGSHARPRARRAPGSSSAGGAGARV